MPVRPEKALLKGHVGIHREGHHYNNPPRMIWFLYLWVQIFVLDSAARQGSGRFFSEANKSPCFILIQPNSSHPAYILYISYFQKNIPGTGSGLWTQFYFPLNWDTLQIRKATFSVTGKMQNTYWNDKKSQAKTQKIVRLTSG